MSDSKYTNKRNFTKEHSFKGSGKITAIEVQKTNAERVNIFIEGIYAFSLTMLVAAEHHLKSGLELSAKEIGELQAADLYNLGLAAALELLSRRPRSEAEIYQRLKRRYPEGSDKTFKRVVERLKELNYLNDTDFARYWIENRLACAPRGRLLLQQELLKLGLAREIIETALATYLEVPNDAQGETADEESGLSIEEGQALILARKKARGYAGEDWAGFYRKLGGFLLRRGYDYGLTGRITKQVWKELKESQSSSQ
ncbi:MAG: RecX family transcriptional regulator [Chloroflexi bacterium]|nr:RecX family transcriptional regulator [Chloroflexota bacterium]